MRDGTHMALMPGPTRRPSWSPRTPPRRVDDIETPSAPPLPRRARFKRGGQVVLSDDVISRARYAAPPRPCRARRPRHAACVSHANRSPPRVPLPHARARRPTRSPLHTRAHVLRVAAGAWGARSEAALARHSQALCPALQRRLARQGKARRPDTAHAALGARAPARARPRAHRQANHSYTFSWARAICSDAPPVCEWGESAHPIPALRGSVSAGPGPADVWNAVMRDPPRGDDYGPIAAATRPRSTSSAPRGWRMQLSSVQFSSVLGWVKMLGRAR